MTCLVNPDCFIVSPYENTESLTQLFGLVFGEKLSVTGLPFAAPDKCSGSQVIDIGEAHKALLQEDHFYFYQIFTIA